MLHSIPLSLSPFSIVMWLPLWPAVLRWAEITSGVPASPCQQLIPPTPSDRHCCQRQHPVWSHCCCQCTARCGTRMAQHSPSLRHWLCSDLAPFGSDGYWAASAHIWRREGGRAISKEGSGRLGALFAPEIALSTSWHSQIVGMPK